MPVEGIAIILGVDRILDMARTFCNVTGNCVAAAVVARWENEISADDLAKRMKEPFSEEELENLEFSK